MSAVDELWAVTRRVPHVDAMALARAVEAAATCESLDYRSRLLVRDSVRALEAHWGRARVRKWLSKSPNRQRIQQALVMPGDGEMAFPYLKERVVDAIKPETVLELLRELSLYIEHPVRIVIGGSIAL